VKNDPNTLQWLTAVGALVALIFSWRSSRASARSARTAERHLEAQTRPLLIDVPFGRIYEQDREIVVPGSVVGATLPNPIEGTVLVGSHWVSLPLRNVGQGLARVTGAGFEVDGERFAPAELEITMRNVPPGEETRLGLSIPDPHGQHFTRAVENGSMEVYVEYTDLTGGQRQRTTVFVKRPNGEWRVLLKDHELV
jgi:hypothetical protein